MKKIEFITEKELDLIHTNKSNLLILVSDKLNEYFKLCNYTYTYNRHHTFEFDKFTFYLTYWGIVWWKNDTPTEYTNVKLPILPNEITFREMNLEMMYNNGFLIIIKHFMDMLLNPNKVRKFIKFFTKNNLYS